MGAHVVHHNTRKEIQLVISIYLLHKVVNKNLKQELDKGVDK